MPARWITAGATCLALAAVLVAILVWAANPRGSSFPPPAEVPEAPALAPPSLSVTDVSLGRGVDLDKRISAPAEVFDPHDTIYVSVVTEGSARGARLTAHWSREGEVLAETSQIIAPRGTAVSEFNVWKPQGWPPGQYQVEVLVDGVSAASRHFSVR